jgi:hypothetical protein
MFDSEWEFVWGYITNEAKVSQPFLAPLALFGTGGWSNP